LLRIGHAAKGRGREHRRVGHNSDLASLRPGTTDVTQDDYRSRRYGMLKKEEGRGRGEGGGEGTDADSQKREGGPTQETHRTPNQDNSTSHILRLPSSVRVPLCVVFLTS
jgi:hypothetical protein